MLSTSSRAARAELASATALTRRKPNDKTIAARLEAARRNFYAARLEDYVRQTVEAAPDLSPEQRDRLATLIRGGDHVAA